MADYTAISSGETNPGAPLTSSLMKRLANNPTAIAEGASGAPRIHTAALIPPAAGNVTIAKAYNSETGETEASNTAYGSLSLVSTSTSAIPVFFVVRGGTVRVSVEHRANVASGSAQVRVLRNQTEIGEWSTSSSSFITRTIDFSVAAGDRIIFQQRVTITGQSIWRDIRIMSNTSNLAVIPC